MKSLKARGIRIGVASSSKNAQTVLKQLRIEKEFDTVIDGSMIRKTKPDPEIFLLAAERMGVDPRFCVVIEDAEAGVEAARAAGMKCIGIGSPALLGNANKVFVKTSDIQLSTLRELERENK